MNRQVTITLVRHGETAMNAKRLIQGRTDTPLSEDGIKQAETLGKYLSKEVFSRSFSSDLQRASNTAKIILSMSENPVEIVIDKRLCERGFGEAEGKYAPDINDEAKKIGVPFHHYTPVGGETFMDVQNRVQDFFNDVLCSIVDGKENDTVVDENILVVTHGGWILALMRYLNSHSTKFILKDFVDAKALKIPRNTGRTKFSLGVLSNHSKSKQMRVIDFALINDTQHLN